MKKEQIIKKIVKKAEKNGFDLLRWYCKECNLNNNYYTPLKSEAFHFVFSHKFMQTALFFNNDFAKVYWGNAPLNEVGISVKSLIIYLKQVAINHEGKLIFVGDKSKVDFEHLTGEGTITHITYQMNRYCQAIALNQYEVEHVSVNGFLPAWRYHQNIMLEKVQEGRCPLQYLEKFL